MTGLLFIILACVLWAADTLIRYPLLGEGLTAYQIVLSEHLILVLIFSPMLFKARQVFWSLRVSDLFSFVVIGGLGSALATLAFTQAFLLVNPSLVILLQKLQPLVAILLARILLKESLHKGFWPWAGVCLIGGILVSWPDLMGLTKLNWGTKLLGERYLLGYGLTLVAVVSWGSSTVFGKRLVNRGLSEPEVMGGRFVFGLLFLLPFMSSYENQLDFELEIWGKIAVMVLLSGWLGMFFYYKGLTRISAKVCALAEMFFPLCAVSINWIFLDAKLSTLQIVGAGLLLLGPTVIQLKRY
jgi:drug/metabolite transporter (DMT)-like permease